MSALRRLRRHPALSGRLGENTKRTQRPRTLSCKLPTPDSFPKKSREFLLDGEGNILIDRYEWFLYQQIPDRLNGQLTLPDITKYRALDADLIDGEHWRKNKYTLLQQSHFTKLAEEPEKLIKQMAMELDTRLYEVGEYLEQEDNRNIILRNPQGKRFWRLPSASKHHLVNNPFFQQIPTTGIADVLRMVDSDTGFIDCFAHVLGSQSRSRSHEYDLLAILVGNATNQGIYGMAQISDRTYDQLSTIRGRTIFASETLNAANDNINNATAKLPIFRYYNIRGRCDPRQCRWSKVRSPARDLQNPLFVEVLWHSKRCFCHDLDRQSRCDQRQSDRRQRT